MRIGGEEKQSSEIMNTVNVDGCYSYICPKTTIICIHMNCWKCFCIVISGITAYSLSYWLSIVHCIN